MSLLKDLYEEAAKGSTSSDKVARIVKETVASGAVGAHAIAGARGSLFGGGVVDHDKMVRRSIAKAGRVGKIKYSESAHKPLGKSFLSGLLEADEGEIRPADQENFDPKDVISKLDAAQKRSSMGDDTTAFGLEDEEGQIVKVYVPKEEAEEFEAALAQMLNGADEDDDDETTSMEIAEVLFNMRDKFSIVDVEWPQIPEDAEEDQEADAGEAGAEGDLGAEGEAGAEGEGGGDLEGDAEGGDMDLDAEGEGGEDEMDMTADTADDGAQQAADALTQVIDMMKADSEAKMAEAKAREAEAKAKEAEALAKTANAKVAGEEQVLDMEAHEEKKKKASDEAKQLAKLAKFRHETKGATTNGDFMDVGSGDEEDEEATTINVKDFASLLQQHLQGQG